MQNFIRDCSSILQSPVGEGGLLYDHTWSRLQGEGLPPIIPKSTPNVSQSTIDISQSTIDISQSTIDISQSTPDIPQSIPIIPQSTPDIPQSTPSYLKVSYPKYCKINLRGGGFTQMITLDHRGEGGSGKGWNMIAGYLNSPLWELWVLPHMKMSENS